MQLKLPLSYMSLVLAVSLTGCEDQHEVFRYSVNSAIGHPADIYEYLRNPAKSKIIKEVRTLENGNKEYIHEEENGCSWAYVVDTNGIIVSWHYISDPALCKRRLNWGGPW